MSIKSRGDVKREIRATGENLGTSKHDVIRDGPLEMTGSNNNNNNNNNNKNNNNKLYFYSVRLCH